MPLTKRKIKVRKDSSVSHQNNIFAPLDKFSPATNNQQAAFDAAMNDKHLVISGYPGTGKSYLALAIGMILLDQYQFQKIKIIRSAVPTRDVGFLPGAEAEKLAVYEKPYVSIVNKLLGRGDAYGILKSKGIIDFESTSFLRSITYDNTLVILDEAQNLSFTEIYTVVTRLGEGSRIIIMGDNAQCDLKSTKHSGFKQLLEITSKMKTFRNIDMGIQDIVRSGFVKEFIIAAVSTNYLD